MKKITKTIVAVAILATMATQSAFAYSPIEQAKQYLCKNQATTAICGWSCMISGGMRLHRSACPNCDSHSYKVLSVENCQTDLIFGNHLRYEFRECSSCRTKYKGPQY